MGGNKVYNGWIESLIVIKMTDENRNKDEEKCCLDGLGNSARKMYEQICDLVKEELEDYKNDDLDYINQLTKWRGQYTLNLLTYTPFEREILRDSLDQVSRITAECGAMIRLRAIKDGRKRGE